MSKYIALGLAFISLGATFLPKKNLPQEFIWLYESLNTQKLSQDQENNYQIFTKKIDANLKKITEKRALFLVKSEIYKSILEYGKKSHHRYPKMEISYVDKLRVRFNKNTRSYDDFSRWFILSITNDLKKLTSSPEFLTLGNGKTLSQKGLELKTKLDLINPLVFLILSTPPKTLDFLTIQLKLRILQNIADITAHLVSFSNPGKEQKTRVKSSFDTLTTGQASAPPSTPLFDDSFEPLPEPTAVPLDDWSPSDKDLEILSQSGKIPEKKEAPIPFYTPDPEFTPFIVPTPINDWRRSQ